MKFELNSLAGILVLVTLMSGCVSRIDRENIPIPALLREIPKAIEARAVAEKLPLAVAEQLALENCVELQILRVNAAAARAALSQAVEFRDPELRASYGESDSTFTNVFRPDESSDQTEIAVRIFTPHLWNIRSLRSAAKARLFAAEADLVHLSWQIVVEIRGLFMEMNFISRQLALKEERMELLQQKKILLKELTDQGGATDLDSFNISFDLFDARTDKAALLKELRARQVILAGLVGPVDIQELSFEACIKPDDFDKALLEKLGAENGEDQPSFNVVALAWRLKAAEADQRAETLRKVPWLSYLQLSQQDQEQADQDDESWGIQGAVEIPIFSLLGRGEEKFLKAETKRLSAELTVQMRQIGFQRTRALETLSSTWHEYQSISEGANALLEDQARIIEQNEDKHSLTEFQVMDIGFTGLTVREAVLESEYCVGQAYYALEALMGRSLSDP